MCLGICSLFFKASSYGVSQDAASFVEDSSSWVLLLEKNLLVDLLGATAYHVLLLFPWICGLAICCATASQETGLLSYCQCCYEAPRRDRYIPLFVCQQCLYLTLTPGEFCSVAKQRSEKVLVCTTVWFVPDNLNAGISFKDRCSGWDKRSLLLLLNAPCWRHN